VPHGHWKTLTLVAALRVDGVTAPYVVDGAMHGPAFLAYVEDVLAPNLKKRDIVFMDNVRTHKIAGVAEAIKAAGAELRYLPAYSPDMDPIENLSNAERRGRFLDCQKFALGRFRFWLPWGGGHGPNRGWLGFAKSSKSGVGP
jgi:transposase